MPFYILPSVNDTPSILGVGIIGKKEKHQNYVWKYRIRWKLGVTTRISLMSHLENKYVQQRGTSTTWQMDSCKSPDTVGTPEGPLAPPDCMSSPWGDSQPRRDPETALASPLHSRTTTTKAARDNREKFAVRLTLRCWWKNMLAVSAIVNRKGPGVCVCMSVCDYTKQDQTHACLWLG